MEDILTKILERQEKILTQQAEIFASIRKIEEVQSMLNFKLNQQHYELNARLEITERSTRQIDEQIAILNVRREEELAGLKSLPEKLSSLEELLKLSLVNQIIDLADKS